MKRAKLISHLRHYSTVTALFNKYLNKNDVYSWNSIIAELARGGDSIEALKAFSSMRNISLVKPNLTTFPCTIKSCAAIRDLNSGKQTHQLAFTLGYSDDLFISSALVDMYAKCGDLSDARKVFDGMPERNLVTWSSIIGGFAKNGFGREALLLFKDMLWQQSSGEGLDVDVVLMVSVISACSRVYDSRGTHGVHGFVIKIGIDEALGVGNTLVDAYSKCGDLEFSRKVFDGMIERDLVTWNTMIAVYAHQGLGKESVDLFKSLMSRTDIQFNEITLSSVLLGCAHSGNLRTGKCLHAQVIRLNLEDNVVIGTSVVDMYCKSGRVNTARRVFDRMRLKNVRTWTAMISGYGMHGRAKEAIELLQHMIHDGTKPNGITFVSILSACCHAGQTDEGWHWFCTMQHRFGVDPWLEHYGCMVDLLGRAGQLSRANELITKMKVGPDFVIWCSLLASSKLHKNVEMAEMAAEKLFELDPSNSGYYTMLSNVYADSGKWDKVKRTRIFMKDRGVVKSPGFSVVEVRGRSHVFLAGDRDHPQCKEIYSYLEELSVKLLEAGYVPRVSSALHDVDEEERAMVLRIHSEKLAVVFGIMKSFSGEIVQVTKNLRTCEDCHTMIKLISKVTNREIVVRDPKRFHHFSRGGCSCGDYW